MESIRTPVRVEWSMENFMGSRALVLRILASEEDDQPRTRAIHQSARGPPVCTGFSRLGLGRLNRNSPAVVSEWLPGPARSFRPHGSDIQEVTSTSTHQRRRRRHCQPGLERLHQGGRRVHQLPLPVVSSRRACHNICVGLLRTGHLGSARARHCSNCNSHRDLHRASQVENRFQEYDDHLEARAHHVRDSNRHQANQVLCVGAAVFRSNL